MGQIYGLPKFFTGSNHRPPDEFENGLYSHETLRRLPTGNKRNHYPELNKFDHYNFYLTGTQFNARKNHAGATGTLSGTNSRPRVKINGPGPLRQARNFVLNNRRRTTVTIGFMTTGSKRGFNVTALTRRLPRLEVINVKRRNGRNFAQVIFIIFVPNRETVPNSRNAPRHRYQVRVVRLTGFSGAKISDL